jgi:hypothetical protein
MKSLNLLLLITLALAVGCQDAVNMESSDSVIAKGQMPHLVRDKSGQIHLIYGAGDSIMYSSSTDQGNTFSEPYLVSVLPGLAAAHTRGPQIAATGDGLVVTACEKSGNIFSYTRDETGKWAQGSRVNDVDTMAKENLMALAADGNNAFAVWLDLRDRHNKIFGAKSTDGGKTWSQNIMVYASPDSTVCECCKPSVAVRKNKIYVMFRNWVDGNRDLYLVQSADGGSGFGAAQKLGKGSWPLKGCPMDGGSLAVDQQGNPETVWNRKGVIYVAVPGEEEQRLGEGRNGTLEPVNGKTVYAWVADGNVIIRKPEGMQLILGKGQLPVIKAVDNGHILCVWENDKQIHKAVLRI